MARFFMACTNLTGGRAIIRGRDAEHIRVLRMRPGEEVTICDGDGTDYIGSILRVGEDEAEVEILRSEPTAAEPSVRTTVLAGLPKGERGDYLVQKCTEAGAADIFFFQCTRCIAKPNNIEKKLERWRRIAEEAAKQSGRGVIPHVFYLEDFGEVLNKAVHCDLGLFLYETGERISIREAVEAKPDAETAAIITGPEGGFAEFEAKLASVCGLHVCSMGERILRCETAPVVATTAVMYATGNLS